MTLAHLNIGSNSGHRPSLLARAVALLANQCGQVVAVSPIHLSAPQGFNSPNEFMNIGVALFTTLSAHQLLAKMQQIEQQLAPDSPHRDPDNNYIDRLLDLDLIHFGFETIQTDNLTLPHPRWKERDFVTAPFLHTLFMISHHNKLQLQSVNSL